MSWSVTSASVDRTALPLTRSTSAPVAEESSRTRSDSFARSGQAPTENAPPAEPFTASAPTADDASESDHQPASSTEFSSDEQRMITELQARDREVRAHEAAHQAAGGGAVGGASYSFQQGPNGRQYAVGGEVQVDMSTSGGSPEATIAKMERVRAAAMAPADPSAQDFAVAAAAAAIEAAVRQEQRATSADAQSGSGKKKDDGEVIPLLGATTENAGDAGTQNDKVGARGERKVAFVSAAKSSGERSDTDAPEPKRSPVTAPPIMGAASSASSERTTQRALGAYRAASAGSSAAGIDQRV